MKNDRQALAANIKAREEAEAAFSLLDETLGTQPSRVYEELIKLCRKKLNELSPQIPPPAAIEDDARIRRIERSIFPRGKFAGQPVSNVPSWYILGWAQPQDKFTVDLRWYVTTRRFTERTDAEEPDDDDERYDEERDESR